MCSTDVFKLSVANSSEALWQLKVESSIYYVSWITVSIQKIQDTLRFTNIAMKKHHFDGIYQETWGFSMAVLIRGYSNDFL